MYCFAGYFKLHADESSFPERRITRETIEEDEGVYTHISSDNLYEPGVTEDVMQETNVNIIIHEELDAIQDEEQEECLNNTILASEPNIIRKISTSKSVDTISNPSTSRKTSIKTHRNVFGPQTREQDKFEAPFTPIERKLSGIIKANKLGYLNLPTAKKKNLSSARSLPDLTLPTALSQGAEKSTCSPKNSGDSSGYKSEGGSPNHKYLSPARSQCSDSDYGYTTITELMKPKPLAQHRLGHIPPNSSQIPKECFTSKEVPRYNDDESGKNKLFDIKYYMNSITFMRSFADIFTEKLAKMLGFTSALDSATLQGSKIFCQVVQTGHDSKPIKIQNEIIPTIHSSFWPQEASKWKSRKRPEVKAYTWPTQTMMEQVVRLGCHLLPQGFLPTRGINIEQYLEWQIAFPEAERCLEMWLTHSQTRCLLFCYTLYKTFLEPLNTQSGFNPSCFQTLLFWECEQNFARWPEDRPGDILNIFLLKMYEALKQRNLSDYFLKRKNVLESVPGVHIGKVQEKLKRITENPVMHILIALRNLRYVEASFYPVLDYKKLYTIITTDNLAGFLNPDLPKTIRSKPTSKQQEDEQKNKNNINFNTELKKIDNDDDVERKWNKRVRKQIEMERAAQKLTNPPPAKQRRSSTDSIDIDVSNNINFM